MRKWKARRPLVASSTNRRRRGDRAGAAGHRREVLRRAELDVVELEPFERGCAGERGPEQR
jgi:hypothetical protein